MRHLFLSFILAVPAFAEPVATPPPNAPYQSPAFPAQTRADEIDVGVTLKAEPVVTGMVNPWAIAPLPGGGFVITERPGRMRLLVDNRVSEPLEGLPPVDAREQGGLLDVALSPNFARDHMIYWSYAEPRDDDRNNTAVARGRLSRNLNSLQDVEVIFRQQPAWKSTRHFGSRLVFAPDGTLFITLGERSDPEPRQLAQDPATHMGKIVRINPDGSIPDDNPQLGAEGNYAMGLRNVQAAAIDADGQLWTVEHGPRGGDELNCIDPGGNYGWPVITYGIDYSGAPIGEGITAKEGLAQPVYYWDPVIAPSGATFYEGSEFRDWRGSLLIGSLNPGGLVRLTLDGGQVSGEARYLPDIGRVRDVAQAADGRLYIITDSADGAVYRVRPD